MNWKALVCLFLGHKFDMPEVRFDCLYFCRRGCGHEYAGRTLDDLKKMPAVDPSDIDYGSNA